MADDKNLRDLALKFTGCGQNFEAENLVGHSQPLPMMRYQTEDEDSEEWTSSSDDSSDTQETQSSDQEVDAGHAREKRRTQSPPHLVPEERTSFLELVRGRFPPEDDPIKTHHTLLETVAAFEDGGLKKSKAHAEACILLIGHADLLHKFERLVKLGDQVDKRRSRVMKRFMRDVDSFLVTCKFTVEAIKEGPLEPTAADLRCIGRIIDDPAERSVLVADLQKADPKRSDALLRLEKKVKDVDRMKAFVSAYFAQRIHDDQ